MAMDTMARCENLACLCEVSGAEATCSGYCASPDGQDPQQIRCNCGHAVCHDAIETQLHGAAGRESVS
jgi:hypothetical protein